MEVKWDADVSQFELSFMVSHSKCQGSYQVCLFQKCVKGSLSVHRINLWLMLTQSWAHFNKLYDMLSRFTMGKQTHLLRLCAEQTCTLIFSNTQFPQPRTENTSCVAGTLWCARLQADRWGTYIYWQLGCNCGLLKFE